MAHSQPFFDYSIDDAGNVVLIDAGEQLIEAETGDHQAGVGVGIVTVAVYIIPHDLIKIRLKFVIEV